MGLWAHCLQVWLRRDVNHAVHLNTLTLNWNADADVTAAVTQLEEQSSTETQGQWFDSHFLPD